MKVFETTFIVNPQADDATIDRQVKSVADVITGNGGKILHESRLGTRKLAYDINRLSQGYYSQLVFEAAPPALTALERHFKLSEEFLRHLTLLVEGDFEKIKEARANRQAAGDDRPERGRYGRGDRDRDRGGDRDRDRGGDRDRGRDRDRDSDRRDSRDRTDSPRSAKAETSTDDEEVKRTAAPVEEEVKTETKIDPAAEATDSGATSDEEEL